MTTATCNDRPGPAPAAEPRPRRWLFVKDRLAWPRSSGHDVHSYHLMKALTDDGHAVALATLDRPTDAAIDGLSLAARFSFAERTPSVPPDGSTPIRLTKWQEKFRSYWGVDPARIRWVAAATKAFDADAVVVVGLNVLPYLGAVTDRQKIWYAADEWVWHHLSQVSVFKPGTWKELKPAAVKGLYERAYAPMLDRVWVVSESDAKAYRHVTGYRHTDVMPNGVDAEYFSPGDEVPVPNSCAFWGRLDFGPNVQAVEWFVTKVWPRVRANVPAARFDVFGFQPTAAVVKLLGRDGTTLTPDVPDLRPEVRARAVTVLPFVSGGGIKNKLLEAAAMGLPVLATPRVAAGLVGSPPVVTAKSPAAFADELVQLWQNDRRRALIGAQMREWVTTHHTWAAVAKTAVEGLAKAAKERT